MLYARILYICFLLFAFIFYVFSNHIFALVFLSLFIILGIMMFIYRKYLKDSVEISILSKDKVYKNNDISITVLLKNKSILPISFVRFSLFITNYVNQEKIVEEFTTSIPSRGSKEMKFSIRSEYSGTLEIATNYIISYDILGLFQSTSQHRTKTNVVVLPTIHDFDKEYFSTVTNETMASTINNEKGLVNEEIIGLKEYTPGDNIKQIHWKLSSKLDDIIMKELASIQEEKIAIVLETSLFMENKQERLDVIDMMSDTFASLIYYYSKKGKQIIVSWYDDTLMSLRMEYIDNVEEVVTIFFDYLSAPVTDLDDNSYELFLQKMPYECTVLYVTTKWSNKKIDINNHPSTFPIYAEEWIENAEESVVRDEGVM